MNLYNAEDLKAIDSETYSIFGYPESILMENAGSGSYRKLLKIYGEKYLKKAGITVICGKGNNGGDGFVIARYLLNIGADVKTVILSEFGSYSGISLKNLEILKKFGSKIVEIANENHIDILSRTLADTGLLIDSIFGTGLNRNIGGFFKKIICLINEMSDKYGFDIICVDVPSGLNSDTGSFMGAGIKKNIKSIFTFGGLKPGFYLQDGETFDLGAKTVLIDINHPKHLLEKYRSSLELLTEDDIIAILPVRKKTSTKFDYGHLLVAAGSTGKSGAAYMASLGGFKAGAGLVTLAVPSAINGIMEVKTTEIMTYPLDSGKTQDKKKGFFTVKAAQEIVNNILKGKEALVVGPGIGLHTETASFLFKLITLAGVPMVIDADGLNLLSKNMEILSEKKADIILTPHYKEMERLSGIDRKIIEKDPLKIGREFVKKYGVYLILKGSTMYIFHKNAKDISIQNRHNPLLASGGSGDVLSGVAGSFIAQGVSIYQSLQLSSFLIVYAANILSLKFGDTGAGAVKIASYIPFAIKSLKEKFNRI